MSTRIQGHCLVDLIRGKTPEYIGWSTDPTTGHLITDGDLETYSSSGENVIGSGYQFCHLEWDLGRMERFVIAGFGYVHATAGTAYTRLQSAHNGSWYENRANLNSHTQPLFECVASAGNKVRLSMTSTVAATITHEIYEFKVLRI